MHRSFGTPKALEKLDKRVYILFSMTREGGKRGRKIKRKRVRDGRERKTRGKWVLREENR